MKFDENIHEGQEKEILGRKLYVYLDTLPDFAIDVAKKHNIDIDKLNLKLALVYPEVAKNVAGRCMIVHGQTKLLTDVNYFITFSGELWDELGEAQQELLVAHELMHIYKVLDLDGSVKRLALKGHDVQDFRYLIKSYGIDWLEYMNESKQLMDELVKRRKEEKELAKAKKKEEVKNV